MTQRQRQPVLVRDGKMSLTLREHGEELARAVHLTEEQKQKAFGMAIKLAQRENLQNVNQGSLIAFCFEVARHNYIREDALYPVPYDNLVQAQAGYKALKEEAERSGKYRLIDAVVVKEVDKITTDALTSYVSIEFETDYHKREQSKTVGYYAFAIKRRERQPFISDYWSMEKVLAHREKYAKKNRYGKFSPAWENNFDAMAIKTALKSLLRKVDITPELESLIRLDQIVFDEQGRPMYLDNPQARDTRQGELYVKELQTTPTTPKTSETKQVKEVKLEAKEKEQQEIDEIVREIEKAKQQL